MLTIWGVITVATLVGGMPTVSGLWLLDRWRARRRNRHGHCAICGRPWQAGTPFLVQGQLVCEACARSTRRRLGWEVGLIGLAGAGASAATVAVSGGTLLVLLPLAGTAAMTVAAVQLMKRANRDVERRIALGEWPDIDALPAPRGSGTARGDTMEPAS
jgi:hypothetical protein